MQTASIFGSSKMAAGSVVTRTWQPGSKAVSGVAATSTSLLKIQGCPARSRRSPEGGADAAAQIELPGVPLGSFSGSNYDDVVLDLRVGDEFVFVTDGVTEALDPLSREFGAERLLKVIDGVRDQPARDIVDAIFAAVQDFRGEMPPNDDTTAVEIGRAHV